MYFVEHILYKHLNNMYGVYKRHIKHVYNHLVKLLIRRGPPCSKAVTSHVRGKLVWRRRFQMFRELYDWNSSYTTMIMTTL